MTKPSSINLPPSSIERPAAQAGRFYESDPDLLSLQVDSLLARHEKDGTYDNVAALIVPHAGHYFSGNVAAAAYMALNPQKTFKRLFLIGPSHYEWLDGASVDSDVDYYTTPLGRVAVDRQTALQLIATDSVFSYNEKAHDREHCLEVQLPFLQRTILPPLEGIRGGLPSSVNRIVPIIVSTNDYNKLKRIAAALQPYFNDENLFIISSDFSHYPAYDDACRVDKKTGDAILTGDVAQFIRTVEENEHCSIPNLSTSACGESPIITLMLMLNQSYEIKHLLYQNSGDIDKRNRNRVVGYHAFAILRQNTSVKHQPSDKREAYSLTEHEKQLLKDIARQSIEAELDGHPLNLPPSSINPLPPFGGDKWGASFKGAGAFVTLRKHGQLRGCIGLMASQMPLHQTIARMARAAAFDDPRFSPLQRNELSEIDIEISIITPMRRIHSIDEFQLHKHGIFIQKGQRSGTFLPQVADEVNWTKEEFLGHCSRDKAGLGWDGWRQAELYVYEAIVF